MPRNLATYYYIYLSRLAGIAIQEKRRLFDGRVAREMALNDSDYVLKEVRASWHLVPAFCRRGQPHSRRLSRVRSDISPHSLIDVRM
jgi:hypothetical protein